MGDKTQPGAGAVPAATSSAPGPSGLVLVSLILVAAVANLNLSVANVALPEIGRAFDPSHRGAQFTLLAGYLFCLLGFLTMLLLWKEGISYWRVGPGCALVGVGVGFAGATEVAQQYPQSTSQITAGIVAILVGAALVYFLFPKKRQEEQLLARYRAQDTVRPAGPTPKRIAM